MHYRVKIPLDKAVWKQVSKYTQCCRVGLL